MASCPHCYRYGTHKRDCPTQKRRDNDPVEVLVDVAVSMALTSIFSSSTSASDSSSSSPSSSDDLSAGGGSFGGGGSSGDY